MLVLHVDEVDPFGIIREQRVAVKIIQKDLGQQGARLAIRYLLEPGFRPGLFITLDDKSAGRLVELVRVRGEDPHLRLAKGERQAVKELVRAVPDILVAAHAQGRLEGLSVSLPDGGVDAVSADEQV